LAEGVIKKRQFKKLSLIIKITIKKIWIKFDKVKNWMRIKSKQKSYFINYFKLKNNQKNMDQTKKNKEKFRGWLKIRGARHKHQESE
jgi:hypothetical protein